MKRFGRYNLNTQGSQPTAPQPEDGAQFAAPGSTPMMGASPEKWTSGPPPLPPGGLPGQTDSKVPDLRGDMGSKGGIDQAIRAREQVYPYKYGFVSGPQGMSYSLQGLQRNAWGNPGWGSGRKGLGYADPKYYTDSMYRPMFDFTTQGGGVFPNDPWKKLTRGGG